MTRGVVVAGGRGRRLGLDVPKALVNVGGRPLYENAANMLAVFSSEIVIVAPESVEIPVPAGPLCRRVFDREPGGGPLAGVIAALDDDAYDLAVVLGVDFPFLNVLLIGRMLSRLEQQRDLGAIVPAPQGRLQPLAAVYSRAFCAEMVAAFDSGERSIVRAVERIGPTLLTDDEIREMPGGLDGFFNLNTAEDLAEAERRIAAGKVRT